MKQLMVLVLVASMAAAMMESETVFRPHKEYIYKYESQVISGIPRDYDTFAGMKIIAIARIQLMPDAQALLKIEAAELWKINSKIDVAMSPAEMLPNEIFTKVTGEPAILMKACLSTPCKFSYIGGEVMDIEVGAAEPFWCRNVKRGVLSMLQVKIAPPSAMETSKEMDLIEMIAAKTSPALAKVYRVMEKGVDGECESMYAVKMVAPALAAVMPHMKVIKVRNYDLCKKRPIFHVGLLSNLPPMKSACAICLDKEMDCVKACIMAESDLVKSSHIMEAIVTGTHEHFLIKKAIVTAEHMVNVPIPGVGTPTAFIKQILILENVVNIHAPIMPIAEVVEDAGIIMEIPTPYRKKMMEKMMPVVSSAAKAEIIESVLEAAAIKTTPVIAPEVSDIVYKLITTLRTVEAEEIIAIVMKLKTEAAVVPLARRKLDILVDIMPSCGHKKVIHLIATLLKKDIISPARAALKITKLHLAAVPSPELIKSLVELCEAGMCKETVFGKAVVLTIGTVTRKLVEQHKTIGVPMVVVKEVVEMVAELLIAKLKSPIIGKKVMAIKAIGNCALPKFLVPLEEIILDAALPVVVREEAIIAMRMLALAVPKKVLSIVIPVYMKKDLPAQLRIPAFVMAMKCKPSAGMVNMLAHSIPAEPSVKVASYIWSYLIAMAESKIPENMKMAQICRTVVKTLKYRTPVHKMAKIISLEKVALDSVISVSYYRAIVKSLQSVIPAKIVDTVSLSAFGKTIEVMQHVISTEGMHPIIARIFGPEGRLEELLAGEIPLSEILKPLKAYPMHKAMAEILDKVTVIERVLDKMNIRMNLKVLEEELVYSMVDMESIKEAIIMAKEYMPMYLAKLKEGQAINLLQTLAIRDSAIMMPTAIGIPLVLDFTSVAMVSVKGVIKVDGIPTNIMGASAESASAGISDIVDSMGASAESASAGISASAESMGASAESAAVPMLIVDVVPSVMVAAYGRFGVDAGILHAGVSIEPQAIVNIPIKMEVAVNPISGKVSMAVIMPKKEVKVVRLETRLKSYFHMLPAVPVTGVFIRDDKVIEPIPARFIKKVISKVYGSEAPMAIIVKAATYRYAADMTIPAGVLHGSQFLEIIHMPAPGVPARIEVVAKYIAPEAAYSDMASILYSSAESVESTEIMGGMETMESIDTMENIETPWRSWKSSDSIIMGVGKKEWLGLGFTPVVIMEAISSPIKRQIVMVIRAIAGPATAALHAQITHCHSPNWLKHQANVQMIYTPMGMVAAKKKIIMKASVVIPKFLINPDMPIPAPAVPVEIVAMKIEAGPVAAPEMLMGVKAFVGKPMAPEIPIREETPIHVSAVIEYQPMPAYLKKVVKAAYGMVKTMTTMCHAAELPATCIEMVDEENAPSKITVMAAWMPALEKMKVIVKTPWETMIIKKLPFVHPIIWDMTMHSSPWSKMIGYATSGMYPATCSLMDIDMMTFDQVAYSIPITKCEMILAKDCTGTSRFMVTAAAIPNVIHMKIVKVILAPGVVIEVMPSPMIGAKVLKVLVNGVLTKCEEGIPVIIRMNMANPMAPIISEIKLIEGMLQIVSKPLGVMVITDCNIIKIKTVPSWHSRMCGMCGDFNGEVMGEFMGPKMEVYKDPKHFAMSYYIPSETCDIHSLHSEYMFPMIAAPGSACVMKSRNAVVERIHFGKREICFSTVPVLSCPVGCKPAAVMPTTKSFHCLRAKNRTAKRMLVMSKARPLEEMAYKTEDLYQEINIPAKCVPVV